MNKAERELLLAIAAKVKHIQHWSWSSEREDKRLDRAVKRVEALKQ